ncbi:MAG: hypothetical protein AB1592_18165 [Pseudomonadota bacterium]
MNALILSVVIALAPAGAFAQSAAKSASEFLARTPAAAPSAEAPLAPVVPEVLRDYRYCEIIPVTVSLSGFTAQVFNTLGYGDCPQDQWKGVGESEMRKRFGAVKVLLNGPRHFIMDKIIPKGATARGEIITVNGLTLESRATIDLTVADMLGTAYREHMIDRETTYRFDAGKPTFRLTDPDGAVYVMQSYAKSVDPALSYEALPALGAKLKLPTGWSYGVVTPDTPLMVKAEGKAVVIQDDFKNTYQKMTP